jgi:hypothetical protein
MLSLVLLISVAAMVSAQQRCELPPEWQVTTLCEGGTVEFILTKGVYLKCPISLPANSGMLYIAAFCIN